MKTKDKLSKNQLRRFPEYLSFLRKCEETGIHFVNAQMMADALNLNQEQVRKDIAAVSTVSGVPNRGRNVIQLIKDIEVVLGYDETHNAILVGVGSLGKALLNYDGFKAFGLTIIAAFDPREELVGATINEVRVYDTHRMCGTLKNFDAHIGIICVPGAVAQSVADELVDNGIEAIWNFAPVRLNLPANIIVSNMNMATSLAELSHKLYLKREKEKN